MKKYAIIGVGGLNAVVRRVYPSQASPCGIVFHFGRVEILGRSGKLLGRHEAHDGHKWLPHSGYSETELLKLFENGVEI